MSIQIEVVFATPELQKLITLEVEHGLTAREAALLSGLDQNFPGLDLHSNPLGIFGEQVKDTHVLEDGDRVELYRELELDPKEARRQRASRSALK